MDPEAFLDLANQVAKLKMYPYFELAHAIVCCLTVKEDMSSGRSFTKNKDMNKCVSMGLFQEQYSFRGNTHSVVGFLPCW